MNLDNIFEPISGFFQSSDISAISKFENDYGITFPDSYKAHLESYGRCMFSGSATIETECKSIVEIFAMYGINCDCSGIVNLVTELEVMKRRYSMSALAKIKVFREHLFLAAQWKHESNCSYRRTELELSIEGGN